MTSRALYYASCASGDNRMAQIFLFLVWLSTARASCMDYLPAFGGTAMAGPSGPVQVIVQSYRFNCAAVLQSVTVRVYGNESGNSALYAQIWRPSDISLGNYYLVWTGSYPDMEPFLSPHMNDRSGDNVTFYTKYSTGFPFLPNDVFGLLTIGQGFQIAYVTSPGGMNVQTMPNQKFCSLSLCSTHVTQGVAPALTVQIVPLGPTITDTIKSDYSTEVLTFCTPGNMSCASTSVVQGPLTTPTYQSTLQPSNTMTSSSDITSVPISIIASVPSAFFVAMVAVVLVLVVVLCVKKRRGTIKGVDRVAVCGGVGSNGSSAPGIGGYSRDHTPSRQEGVQLRHVEPHPFTPLDGHQGGPTAQPHHYSILEMEDFNLIPPSPSPTPPAFLLPPSSSSPSMQSPVPTSFGGAQLHAPAAASLVTTPTGSASRQKEPSEPAGPTSSRLDQHYEVMPGYCRHNTVENRADFNTLGVFEHNNRYWSPATSESGLYSQLNQNKYSELPRSSVRLLSPLGSGNFGQVYLGECSTAEGRVMQVAVKTVKSGSLEVEKLKLLQEAAIMGQFVHHNVVHLVGIVTIGEPLMVVLEYMPKGDLCTFLHKMNPRRNKAAVVLSSSLPSQFIRFAKDIASGMCYLSKKGFVHRDLAARNILLTNDLMCKIGDFGMARDIESENEYYVSHGGAIPVKWTAPEALNHRKYTSASDVWSYGMVLFEIWSLGEKPFSNLTNPIAIALINSKHCQPPPPGCPRAIYHLMIKCWNPEHSCRPTFDSIHDYLDSDEGSLLQWPPEDIIRNKQAHVLGVALSEALDMYPDLQRTYQQPHPTHN